MALIDELAKESFKINIIIQMAGKYFASHQPDIGPIVPDENLIISDVKFTKAMLDLRDIKTTIPTDSFTMLDENNYLSTLILTAGNRLLNEEVRIWLGVITGSFPFNEYVLSSVANIKQIIRNKNSYDFKIRKNINLLGSPLVMTRAALKYDMATASSLIRLTDSTAFPASGYVKIDNELFSYSANDTFNGILSGLTRGLLASPNTSYKIGVLANVNDSLDGKYFIINTTTASWAIWFKSNAGVAPPYPNNIEVDILPNETVSAVAEKMRDAVNLTSVFTASSDSASVIITAIVEGVTSAAIDVSTGFSLSLINLSIADHKIGSDVFLVYYLKENPITMLLQLLISNGGGGVYDVLPYGLGIDPADIDVAGMEALRTTYYPAEFYSFYLYDIEDTQKFIESEICLPTNTRILSSVGKITLVYLDQSTLASSTVDENSIIGTPAWSASVDKVINRVVIDWDYNDSSEIYKQLSIYENIDSQNKYGIFEKVYKFKGVKLADSGQVIIDDIGNKLILRLKDPTTLITANCYFNTSGLILGDTIRVKHRFVPGLDSMGLDADMTLLEKGIDSNTGRTSLGFYYTTISASGILRFGIISPAAKIVSIIDAKTFTIDAAKIQFYLIGYKISINSEIKTITSISGLQITVNSDFININISDLVLIVDYDNSTNPEKNRYAFISPTGSNFPDGGRPFQVVP